MATPGPPPDDVGLLEAIAQVWEQVDPPPADLAEGVLARLAAEDLELDLLTLVENEALAGIRTAPDVEEVGSWTLEYEGPGIRVYLSCTRLEDHTRLDGWIVPASRLGVELRPDKGRSQHAELDDLGRFAFSEVASGPHRLTFSDASGGTRRRSTPPFWI